MPLAVQYFSYTIEKEYSRSLRVNSLSFDYIRNKHTVITNQYNNSEFEELAKKYLDGTITPGEQVRFENWYASFNDEELELNSDRYESVEQLRVAMYQRIEEGMVGKKKRKALFFKIAAAAFVLICFSLALNFYLSDKLSNSLNSTAFIDATDIGPGGNSASLSLNNGIKIELDKLVDGEKIEIEGASFQKNKDGELELIILNSGASTNSSEIQYSTISTPKGGNYKIILPDGTSVWLNSSSSLKFPNAFAKNERKVELVGEAYFNVTRNEKSPFKVISEGQEIKVLGTEFNVSAYPDEKKMKTTLINGSVSVTANNHSISIKPGEQSILEKGEMQVLNVDVANVKAWKDGYFAFDKLSVLEVMNQISRWYNVEVAFESKIPQKQLVGQISKEENLSTVLQMLQYNGVNLSFKTGTIVIK